MDGRALLDRRHPPVPAVLALRQDAGAGSGHLLEPVGALRPDDGAAGGAADAAGGSRGRLQPAAVKAVSACAIRRVYLKRRSRAGTQAPTQAAARPYRERSRPASPRPAALGECTEPV